MLPAVVLVPVVEAIATAVTTIVIQKLMGRDVAINHHRD